MKQAPDSSTPDRYEIIDGTIYDMSPSPNTRHQIISGNLFREFSTYLKGKPCRVFSAPFDVYVNQDRDEWVIPDLSVICDHSKLHDVGCIGAPDLVVEILSKRTATKDRNVKLKLYRATGVKEYWIVDPNFETVEVYRFGGDMFSAPDAFGMEDVVKVSIFDDLEINLRDIFED